MIILFFLPDCQLSSIVFRRTVDCGSARSLDVFGSRWVMSTQVEADFQRRVNGERWPVPTGLEIQALTECVKVRTKVSCGKGKSGNW